MMMATTTLMGQMEYGLTLVCCGFVAHRLVVRAVIVVRRLRRLRHRRSLRCCYSLKRIVVVVIIVWQIEFVFVCECENNYL